MLDMHTSLDVYASSILCMHLNVCVRLSCICTRSTRMPACFPGRAACACVHHRPSNCGATAHASQLRCTCCACSSTQLASTRTTPVPTTAWRYIYGGIIASGARTWVTAAALHGLASSDVAWGQEGENDGEIHHLGCDGLRCYKCLCVDVLSAYVACGVS